MALAAWQDRVLGAETNTDLFLVPCGAGPATSSAILLEITYDPVPLDRKFFGFGLRWDMRHRPHKADYRAGVVPRAGASATGNTPIRT